MKSITFTQYKIFRHLVVFLNRVFIGLHRSKSYIINNPCFLLSIKHGLGKKIFIYSVSTRYKYVYVNAVYRKQK